MPEVVGHSVPRPDAGPKVTGEVRYTSDLLVPGMCVGRLLRLPFPRARIRSIDVTEARAMPGVVAVLTAEDLGRPAPRFGPLQADQPILADGWIRYQGEPVVAVAAEDARTAEAALEVIDVDCDEQPAVSDLEAALADGAALVQDPDERPSDDPWRGTNVIREFRYGWGEPTTDAAVVLENEYRFPPVQHYSVEPHGCLAAWDGHGLTVWSGIQHPFILRSVLASTFGIPEESIRVVVPQIGGSFGGRGYPKVEPVAAALARAAGRPVKVQLTVEESFHTARRAGAAVRIRTGVTTEGTIVSQQIHADFLIGAYADIGLRVVGKASFLACGPYRTPNAEIVARAVASHTPPSSAARGFGAPQLCWALESQMDEIADRLGVDSVEIRLRNLPAHGEQLVPGDTPVDGDWAMGVRAAAEAIGWDRPRERGTGCGLAVGIKSAIPATVSSASVSLDREGRVTVLAGTTEMGQGSRTVLAQIAAEELGVRLENIDVPLPDTGAVPFDSLTASSRSTTIMGLAVQAACRDLRRQLRDGGDPAGGPLVGSGEYRGETSADHPLGGPAPFWEVSVSAVEVVVDGDTGRIRVARHVGVSDIGRAIHPAQATGQHDGAAVMGLGHTLLEELRFDDGQLVNPNLIDYRVPTFSDLPDEMRTIFVENADGPGPYGAKGVGESGIIPVAPSVANAVFRATGARIRELPLTPERVWRAVLSTKEPLRRRGSSGTPRR
jgi:CO/xanthine dehydrogenase Mo-binding subunit